MRFNRLQAKKIGANFSPLPDFVSNIHQWVEALRLGAFTMGWAEDYIWQQPMGTPQMGLLRVDQIRAGLRKVPDADRNMMYYIMPHCPGESPKEWRMMLY
eukprot:SAG22_NODE_10986_length_506_cov_1.007371_2_plen_99_part_01